MNVAKDDLNQMPQLITKETARLREDYPCIEHLEAGNIANWLMERHDQLLIRAKDERVGMNLSKLITITVGVVGSICYATSPLAPIGALIAGVGYVWAVAQDLNDSQQFAPMPFVRANFFEFLAAMGDSEAREQWFSNQNEIVDLMNHLDPFERSEFVMLRQFKNTLTDFLVEVEPGKRFYAYRYLLDTFFHYQSGFPTIEQFTQHLDKVAPDPRINHTHIALIQQQQNQNQLPQLPQPKFGMTETVKFMELPQPKFLESPSPNSQMSEPAVKEKAQSQPPDIQSLLLLPLNSRAIAVIEVLTKSGFDIAKCIRDQITVIAGNQRGGKGTLMAILAILSKALEPQTKIHYFTAGDDIYPFKCDRLVCRLNYPKLDGSEADARVAEDLYSYLKKMDNATQGEYNDIILVIDEAVALSGYLTDDQKQWIIRFLFTRANKKGAQIFIVLHGKNLTSWVGRKNTAGFGDTFKTGATFVGCEASSKKLSPLKSISVATGKYFLADPDSFEKALLDGEIGIIPEWLKTEINPATGQPDPARTLLKYFPELIENSSTFEDTSKPLHRTNLDDTVQANKIGTADGQLLAPLQGQISLTTAVMDAQIKAVSDFLNQEFNPSQETSVFGSAVQKIQNLLDEKRSDSLQGVFSAAIANVTTKDGVLAAAVKAVVSESVKPLADEVEKLAQQVREKELVKSVLEQTIAKGASYEEAVLAELEPWVKLYGAEITHIGKDKQPGDILLKFTANSIAAIEISIVIEVRKRNSASWGRKRISDQLIKAMMQREANAAIFLSSSREGLAQEIGYWAKGSCEQGQWVATTHEMLSLAIQFLIVQQQLASQPTFNSQIDCAVIEAQVQQIKSSLNYLTQINSSLTKLQEHSSDIRVKARSMRTEIRNALLSISESISSKEQK